jgi:putative transposase
MGVDSFKEWVREKYDHLRFHREIPGSRELAPSPEKIIDLVCDYFKVKKEQLLISKRGTENLPRDVAIYLVRRHSRETLASVGSHFEIRNYSTVSSVIERIKARKDTDRSLQRHLKRIGVKLAKSQQQT